MDTQVVIQRRRSNRTFSARPVPADTIIQLVDCAHLAPTARNVQPWEFVAVTNKVTLATLGGLCENARFLLKCPCCIAVFCEDTKYYLEDGCAATNNLILAATDLGLASCWVAGDKKEYAAKVGELLNAPRTHKLVSMVALGYADTQPPAPPKRTTREVLHWEKF